MLYIELARRNKKLNQADLAAVARVGQYFISDIELGKALPTLDQRARIARVLEIDPAILTEPVRIPTDEAVKA